MIIITDASEEKLVEWLKENEASNDKVRAIHIPAFDGLYQPESQTISSAILHYISDTLTDSDVRIYQCYDTDIIIAGKGISTQHYTHISDRLTSDYALLDAHLTFYEKENSWYPFTCLCDIKLETAQSQKAHQKLMEQARQKQKARDAALNQSIPSELISTIAERRKTRARLEVLVVEDDPFSRTLVHNSLESKFAVSCAEDGKNAIFTYAQRAPDVMFLDIDLPDISGHEVLRKILEIDPDAYIIMLSANGDRDNIMGAVNKGAKGFVGKPFTISKLLAYIDKAPTNNLA